MSDKQKYTYQQAAINKTARAYGATLPPEKLQALRGELLMRQAMLAEAERNHDAAVIALNVAQFDALAYPDAPSAVRQAQEVERNTRKVARSHTSRIQFLVLLIESAKPQIVEPPKPEAAEPRPLSRSARAIALEANKQKVQALKEHARALRMVIAIGRERGENTRADERRLEQVHQRLELWESKLRARQP